jgi:hypothetical protein
MHGYFRFLIDVEYYRILNNLNQISDAIYTNSKKCNRQEVKDIIFKNLEKL